MHLFNDGASTWIGVTGAGILLIAAAMLAIRPLRTME